MPSSAASAAPGRRKGLRGPAAASGAEAELGRNSRSSWSLPFGSEYVLFFPLLIFKWKYFQLVENMFVSFPVDFKGNRFHYWTYFAFCFPGDDTANGGTLKLGANAKFGLVFCLARSGARRRTRSRVPGPRARREDLFSEQQVGAFCWPRKLGPSAPRKHTNSSMEPFREEPLAFGLDWCSLQNQPTTNGSHGEVTDCRFHDRAFHLFCWFCILLSRPFFALMLFFV